jgi:uncharacterized lipoprotein YmbA
MNRNIWLFLILFIVGCSGSPKIETQLYLLTPTTHKSSTDISKQQTQNAKNIIVLESIKLAEFLDQPGIVLQTDKHQIQVAHYHRWAEPLSQNIHRFILETLSSQSTKYSFQKQTKFAKEVSHLVLSLEVNQFNGTSEGVAMLSGHWELKDSKLNKLIMTKSFYFEEPMTESGYPELVNQLALMLDKICVNILASI